MVKSDSFGDAVGGDGGVGCADGGVAVADGRRDNGDVRWRCGFSRGQSDAPESSSGRGAMAGGNGCVAVSDSDGGGVERGCAAVVAE